MHCVPAIFSALLLTTVSSPLAADTDPGALSDAERAELVALLVDSRDRVEAGIAATPEALWTVKPAPDRWSVAEVVEHLALSETLIRGVADTALATDPHEGWEEIAARTGPAQLVETLGDRSRRFQAPEPLQPSGSWDRAESLRRFSGERAVTLDFVRSTSAPLKRHVATGPPGTMNAAQWLALVGAHTLRHAAQLEETLEAVRAASPAPDSTPAPAVP